MPDPAIVQAKRVEVTGGPFQVQATFDAPVGTNRVIAAVAMQQNGGNPQTFQVTDNSGSHVYTEFTKYNAAQTRWIQGWHAVTDTPGAHTVTLNILAGTSNDRVILTIIELANVDTGFNALFIGENGLGSSTTNTFPTGSVTVPDGVIAIMLGGLVTGGLRGYTLPAGFAGIDRPGGSLFGLAASRVVGAGTYDATWTVDGGTTSGVTMLLALKGVAQPRGAISGMNLRHLRFHPAFMRRQ